MYPVLAMIATSEGQKELRLFWEGEPHQLGEEQVQAQLDETGQGERVAQLRHCGVNMPSECLPAANILAGLSPFYTSGQTGVVGSSFRSFLEYLCTEAMREGLSREHFMGRSDERAGFVVADRD